MNEESSSLTSLVNNNGYSPLQARAGRRATWLTAGAAALASLAGSVLPSSAEEAKKPEPVSYYSGGNRLELHSPNVVFDMNGNGNTTDDPVFNRYALVQTPGTPTEKAGISTTYASAFNTYGVRNFKTLEEFLRANLAFERGHPEVMGNLALAFEPSAGDTSTVFLNSFYNPEDPMTGSGTVTNPATYKSINDLVEGGRLVDVLTADPKSFGEPNWDYVAGNHPNRAFHILRYRVGSDGEKLPFNSDEGTPVYHLLVQPEAKGDRPAHTVLMNPAHMRREPEPVQPDTVTVTNTDTLTVDRYILPTDRDFLVGGYGRSNPTTYGIQGGLAWERMNVENPSAAHPDTSRTTLYVLGFLGVGNGSNREEQTVRMLDTPEMISDYRQKGNVDLSTREAGVRVGLGNKGLIGLEGSLLHQNIDGIVDPWWEHSTPDGSFTDVEYEPTVDVHSSRFGWRAGADIALQLFPDRVMVGLNAGYSRIPDVNVNHDKYTVQGTSGIYVGGSLVVNIDNLVGGKRNVEVSSGSPGR
ncbi:hypothetical protein HYW21_05015 [Candidatus Woesearchaeota archaeon]|nr:hypothetical protein [Candidatus Woesearchaeota archaeon]